MYVLYADDDQLSLDIVERALVARGHVARVINTAHASEMFDQFKRALEIGLSPQIVVVDGHNIARDTEGRPIIDVEPTTLLSWLRRNGLPDNVRYVLYSSDDKMLEQAQRNRTWGFSAAVSKGGEQGGLLALIRTLEQIPVQ